jgi:hypothetical protein
VRFALCCRRAACGGCQNGLPLEEAHRLAYENARDIIACGFDPKL